MKAAEDFITVVLYGHVIAAVKQIIAARDQPYTIQDIAHELVSKYISFNLYQSPNQPDPATKGTSYAYAVDVLTLGML